MSLEKKKQIFNSLIISYDDKMQAAISSFFLNPVSIVKFRQAALFDLSEDYRKLVNLEEVKMASKIKSNGRLAGYQPIEDNLSPTNPPDKE